MTETLTIKEAILLLLGGLSITSVVGIFKSFSKGLEGVIALYFAILFITITGLFILIFPEAMSRIYPLSFSIIEDTWFRRHTFIIFSFILALALAWIFLFIKNL